jgi:hypothetical protein
MMHRSWVVNNGRKSQGKWVQFGTFDATGEKMAPFGGHSKIFRDEGKLAFL